MGPPPVSRIADPVRTHGLALEIAGRGAKVKRTFLTRVKILAVPWRRVSVVTDPNAPTSVVSLLLAAPPLLRPRLAVGGRAPQAHRRGAAARLTSRDHPVTHARMLALSPQALPRGGCPRAWLSATVVNGGSCAVGTGCTPVAASQSSSQLPGRGIVRDMACCRFLGRRRTMTSFVGTALRTTRFLAASAFLALFFPAPLRAQTPVVIDFEGIPQELVFNRFANLGVTFNGPLARDYSETPGIAHSGTQAVEVCFAQEFCTSPLSQLHRWPGAREVQIGYTAQLSQPARVTMQALDGSGAVVGQAEVALAAGTRFRSRTRRSTPRPRTSGGSSSGSHPPTPATRPSTTGWSSTTSSSAPQGRLRPVRPRRRLRSRSTSRRTFRRSSCR
jgi:hypothetical protein